jgi:PadR family transcriptional regulator PadR
MLPEGLTRSPPPGTLYLEMLGIHPRPFILAFLEAGPLYGYELVKRARAEGQLRWEEGTIYPLLHKMEREKLLRSEWRSGPHGKERKYYALTRAGKAALSGARQSWTRDQRLVTKILMGGQHG